MYPSDGHQLVPISVLEGQAHTTWVLGGTELLEHHSQSKVFTTDDTCPSSL